MNTLTRLLGITSIAFIGGLQTSAYAVELDDLSFSIRVNQNSPEAAVFVPTEETITHFAEERRLAGNTDVFANPLFILDWQQDISIELDESKLIANPSI